MSGVTEAAIAEKIAASSVPAAAGKTAVAAQPAAGSGILATTKAVMLSPFFGVAVLVGIIGYELWRGGKDAADFKTVKA